MCSLFYWVHTAPINSPSLPSDFGCVVLVVVQKRTCWELDGLIPLLLHIMSGLIPIHWQHPPCPRNWRCFRTRAPEAPWSICIRNLFRCMCLVQDLSWCPCYISFDHAHLNLSISLNASGSIMDIQGLLMERWFHIPDQVSSALDLAVTLRLIAAWF